MTTLVRARRAKDNVLGTIAEPRKRPSMAGESKNRLRERVGLVLTSENSCSRNCLIILGKPLCGLPREARTEPEVPFSRCSSQQPQALKGALRCSNDLSDSFSTHLGE